MLKFLIFLVLLAGSSLFVTEVFSLEIELQKESERVLDSFGWLTPEKFSMQEQIQIIIDETNQKNRISIGILSKNANDIRLPDSIEVITSDPSIISFTLTNQFGCAPTKIDKACVIMEVKREGLGDNIDEIRNNTREITDKVVSDGVILGGLEFYSVIIKPKSSFNVDEKILISEATYTVNKQPTNVLFDALANILLSENIRESGGFYDNALKLSEHHFSDFSVTLVSNGNDALRAIHISLVCSNTLPELPKCDPEGNIEKQIARGDISPLDFIHVENVERSKIFADEFLPLNSVIQVLIFSDQNMQVKSVNSNVLATLEQLADIQESGWFFMSKSGNLIDGRYLFGAESSTSKNDLSFSIGSYSEDDIQIKEIEGGGCLIATAAFGSELAPQVQFLREIRDNTILQTDSGSAFMTGFNQFYYSFSPVVADYERENPVFKEAVKLTLTPLLTSLTLLQYADIDSESDVLGYGIGVILLNIGMYFIVPAILIMSIKKRI